MKIGSQKHNVFGLSNACVHLWSLKSLWTQYLSNFTKCTTFVHLEKSMNWLHFEVERSRVKVTLRPCNQISILRGDRSKVLFPSLPFLYPPLVQFKQCQTDALPLGISSKKSYYSIQFYPTNNRFTNTNYKIWNRAFYFNKRTANFYHRFCISLQAYLVEHYCITVPPCPDII